MHGETQTIDLLKDAFEELQETCQRYFELCDEIRGYIKDIEIAEPTCQNGNTRPYLVYEQLPDIPAAAIAASPREFRGREVLR